MTELTRLIKERAIQVGVSEFYPTSAFSPWSMHKSRVLS